MKAKSTDYIKKYKICVSGSAALDPCTPRVKELGDIDLVVSHHPLGRALADLHEVMELQIDVLNQYGVLVNIGEGLMRVHIF